MSFAPLDRSFVDRGVVALCMPPVGKQHAVGAGRMTESACMVCSALVVHPSCRYVRAGLACI